MSEPIRSVAILGGGIIGWSAAAAFKRALPGVAVTVIPVEPPAAAVADRAPYATPAIHAFHAAIGLDEGTLLRAGAATPLLGFAFHDWPQGAAPWTYVHASHGPPIETAPMFHHHWAALRRMGKALPYHRYSAAGVMAEADRFVHPQGGPETALGSFDYGYRLRPTGYRDVLAAHARRMGAAVSVAGTVAVERGDNGRVEALVVGGQSRVLADLFLDCGGPDSILAQGAFDEWRLPFDRVAFDAAEAGPHACERLAASSDGWSGEGVTVSRQGGIAIWPGRRVEPWQGNVLALGDASIALDPLHGLGLQCAHRAILRALALLPARGGSPLECREYNRRASEEAEVVRDFVTLHYLPWGAEPSGSLEGLLDSFERRGRLEPMEDDAVGPEAWIAALIGLGHVPRALDPLAGNIELAMLATQLEQRAAALAALPARLPTLRDYLRQVR